MRTCHICGKEVDDGVYICPDCGAEIVGDTGGLQLKAAEPEKKRRTSASLGTTVSTGSGLTDILRREDDEYDNSDQYLGSVTANAAFMNAGGDDMVVRKRKPKIGSAIFKIALVAALAFGIYMLVTKVLLNEEGPSSVDKAISTYIEAINDQDLEKMTFVTPAYFNDREAEAKIKLEEMKGIHIDSYDKVDEYDLDSEARSSLKESIKLNDGKSANVTEVCNVKLKVTGELGSLVNSGAKTGEIVVQVVCIRDCYYVLLKEYETITFGDE